ncbi:ead/Ea22-like family protein [Klebsiella pneumoniae]|uniref:ead/Ea22-like family protein n=1 Tax=Klebsiella pneumoniae TaxID=573 RepID=UPI003D7B5C10
MTDITELAQRNELLIANGQQTADLLRHLADNEIDSDYFAVVSECESYGKETDAELSITEFALRAAGYVDALVEALEKAQQQMTESENRVRKQNRHICELFDDNTALRQRIAELESRTVKLPKLKMLEDYLAEVAIEERKQILVGVKLEFHRACAAAGIKVEAE